MIRGDDLGPIPTDDELRGVLGNSGPGWPVRRATSTRQAVKGMAVNQNADDRDVHVLPSDLESGLGLINLITAAADAVGREVRPPADHSDLAVAQQLLVLLGLAEPAER